MSNTPKTLEEEDREKSPSIPDRSYDSHPPSGPQHSYGKGGVGLTQRRLTARHVTFIGFGGGIGTGLFIGTGSALASAGPAGLLLAYVVVGAILWCVMECLGEMATFVSYFSITTLQTDHAKVPQAGTFPHYATRFVDPALGFTLAISYGYCYTIAIASEVSAAAVLVVRP